MAEISKNVSERVFNISDWHGVNEAREGEARLRLGEAAVMRNFCVTSGGALKKRRGSMNVAGLLNAYTVGVDGGPSRVLMTDRGTERGYVMYPRAEAGGVGQVVPAGEPATVTAGEAGRYRGYYYRAGDRTYRFDRCVRTPAVGAEAIEGGRITPGEPAAAASGVERWTRDGGSVYTGDGYVDTWGEARIEDGTVRLAGAVTRRVPPTATVPGTDTSGAGGYMLRNGALYRYYGARVDSYRQSFGWKKYRCANRDTGVTTYAEGPWMVTEFSEASAIFVSGWSDYRFNTSTGNYSPAGRSIGIAGGDEGTVYTYFNLNECTRMVLTKSRRYDRSDLEIAKSRALGPFTSQETGYARGEYLGDVTAEEGRLPDEETGLSYVDTFTEDGVTYTVMGRGQELYCYTKDEAGGAAAYERAYSFLFCPVAVSVDTDEWYFNDTYAVANNTSDTAVRGIWSGFVGGREVLCAACGGALWELSAPDEGNRGAWGKISCGSMDTSRDVYMFGFDRKLYILNGSEYLCWDGERLGEVEGYRPLVSVSVEPGGGGTLLESVNRLTPARRCRFSPDGEATVFRLPESGIASVDWVRDLASGAEAEDFAVDLAAGTVTFVSPPERGINTLEIAWSAVEDSREQVAAMRFAEIYNGAQDSRVFIYGDGTNRAFYSGLDYDGVPRADYFPELCEVAVGDANTPVTAMIRHYNKLMAFKTDSAWSIGYDTITLQDGTVTAGFRVAPVNRSVGNCAMGQAQLVRNRPRTLDGRSVIEWVPSGSGTVTDDQRNAERVSERVDSSIRKFDLSRARTFYDKFSHEYYVIGEDGTAIVQNLDVDAWYVYTNLQVTCMINYRDELYYGTGDGYLRHFSDAYMSDNGEAIDACWESGAMSFSSDFRRKYSATVWIGIKPEDKGCLEVTAETDRKSDFAVYDVRSSNVAGVPETERVKLKARKFTYYKLILRNNTADTTCTVVSADMRVRGAGIVR